MLPNELVDTRISRPRRLVLGKNARARYWLVWTWRMLNTTPCVRLLQLPSYCEACTKLTRADASHVSTAASLRYLPASSLCARESTRDQTALRGTIALITKCAAR